jgi:hypothetical protein
MTIERKLLFGLDDIKAISFQCSDCKYRVTMSPDDIKGVPKNCPNGHRWLVGEPQTKVIAPLAMFAETLVTLVRLTEQKALGYRVLLEFDESVR